MATEIVTHTPAPWLLDDEGPTIATVKRPERHDMEITAPMVSRFHTLSDEEQTANADLLAAAPELLDSLKAMVSIYDGVRDAVMSQSILDKLATADAAIDRAEGR